MRLLKNVLPNKLKSKFKQLKMNYFDGYSAKSYSQEGEDMLLRRIFYNIPKGFYVDVGAHHPKRFSNTYYFYSKGWRGINIDARPGSMKEFDRLRPGDINIEAAIAKEPGELTYYMFNDPALNSFDKSLSESKNSGKFRIINKKKLVTQRLDTILARHLPPKTHINFMSIDVEGLDLEVLQSIDLHLIRPEFILIECFGLEMQKIINDPIWQYMAKNNYIMFAKTINTVFFKDNNQP